MLQLWSELELSWLQSRMLESSICHQTLLLLLLLGLHLHLHHHMLLLLLQCYLGLHLGGVWRRCLDNWRHGHLLRGDGLGGLPWDRGDLGSLLDGGDLLVDGWRHEILLLGHDELGGWGHGLLEYRCRLHYHRLSWIRRSCDRHGHDGGLLLLDLDLSLVLGAVDSKENGIFIGQLSCYLLDCIFRKILVGLPQVNGPMCVGAVLPEAAHLLVLVELALLGLVVVVGDVEQFKLHLHGQGVHLHTVSTGFRVIICYLRLLFGEVRRRRAQSGTLHPLRSAPSACSACRSAFCTAARLPGPSRSVCSWSARGSGSLLTATASRAGARLQLDCYAEK